MQFVGACPHSCLCFYTKPKLNANCVKFSNFHKYHASSRSYVLTWGADMQKIPQIVQPVSGVWDAAVYFSVFLFSCQAAFSIHPVSPTKHAEPLFAPLANFAFLEHCWQFCVWLTFANLSLTVPLSLGKVKWSRLTIFPLSPLRFIFSLGLILLAGLSQYLVKLNLQIFIIVKILAFI